MAKLKPSKSGRGTSADNVTSGHDSVRRGKVAAVKAGKSPLKANARSEEAAAKEAAAKKSIKSPASQAATASPDREFTLTELMNLLRAIKSDGKHKVSDLALQFKTDTATMTRVLKSLTMCGIPPYMPSDLLELHFERAKGGERIVSLKRWTALEKGPRLTRDELYALRLSIDAYVATASDPAREVAESLLGKVNRALGIEVTEGGGSSDDDDDEVHVPEYGKLGAGRIVKVSGKKVPEPVDKHERAFASKSAGKALVATSLGHRVRENLERVQEGLRRGVKLVIEYYTGHTGKLDARTVWPLLLREDGGSLYLLAFCELRGANRSFRLDRVRSVEITDEKHSGSQITPSDLPEHIPGWDGTLAMGQFTVRLEPVVKDEAIEEFEPLGAAIRELKDGRVDLTLPLFSRPWAIGWVLKHGPHAELIEPKHLRDELISRLRNLEQQFHDVR